MIELRWPRTDVAQIVLLGEHDLTSGEELEATLTSVLDVSTKLVVDLTGVEFIDTTLINGLCRAKMTFSASLTAKLLMSASPESSPVSRCRALPVQFP